MRDSSFRTHEETLIRSAVDGDRQAQQQLLVSIHPFVRQFLFRLVGQSPEIEDLQQIVLMRVVDHLPTFRFGSAFQTWVGGICVHAARDALRRQKVRQTREFSPIDESFGVDSLDTHVDARRELNRFERALQRLSVPQRTALVLRAVEGYSVEEVAAMMNSAVSTTRMRLYIARKLVAAQMARLKNARLVDP